MFIVIVSDKPQGGFTPDESEQKLIKKFDRELMENCQFEAFVKDFFN